MKKTISIFLCLITVVLIVTAGYIFFPKSIPDPVEGSLTISKDITKVKYAIGKFYILLKDDQLIISHQDNPGRIIWQSVAGHSFVQAATGKAEFKQVVGRFAVEEEKECIWNDQSIEKIEMMPDESLMMQGTLSNAQGLETGYTLVFSESNENNKRLSFHLTTDYLKANRLYLTYESSQDEHFFGFGEQYSYFDLKGKRLPVLVSEQGSGRGLQPLTFLADLFSDAGGEWHTTYAGVPHYITSKMHSLFLENTEYTIFDMRPDDFIQIESYTGIMNGQILSASTPAKLIELYTDYTGRMPILPHWTQEGAIIGLKGGTEKVKEIYRKLGQYNVPIAGFWLQDWAGQRPSSNGPDLWWNWELDHDHYTDWEALKNSFEKKDIRFLGYVNPFLIDVDKKDNARRNLYAEAKEKGYLVTDDALKPYHSEVGSSSFASLIDLTNDDARQWLKDVIKTELIDKGFSGWMADFGEALPYDALLWDGTPANNFHNRYPEEWAEVNREVIKENNLEGEAVFFTRAGFTRSPGETTLMYTGDQLVSWDEHDGIKSAVTAMLSSGISGFSLNHSDIGGYTTIPHWPFDYSRNEELLMRWVELSAFTPFFRTHEGNKPEENVQVYSNKKTIAHFANFARLYASLAPYREKLMQEAANKGLPVVRHPFIHYPNDENVYSITNEQFMLGDEIMVAPVLNEADSTVNIYLPKGDWVHLWSSKDYEIKKGTRITVDAPIGKPGVFIKSGSPVLYMLQQFAE
ncbi:alpha-glucosidase [Limibacter armeniacum]|uniref:alpha-glucosidase n=1 Tax=Limibacter armeniacum TaxID=466084 RepID=UPI002FE641C1